MFQTVCYLVRESFQTFTGIKSFDTNKELNNLLKVLYFRLISRVILELDFYQLEISLFDRVTKLRK